MRLAGSCPCKRHTVLQLYGHSVFISAFVLEPKITGGKDASSEYTYMTDFTQRRISPTKQGAERCEENDMQDTIDTGNLCDCSSGIAVCKTTRSTGEEEEIHNVTH